MELEYRIAMPSSGDSTWFWCEADNPKNAQK
jgi:hypothetical protein